MVTVGANPRLSLQFNTLQDSQLNEERVKDLIKRLRYERVNSTRIDLGLHIAAAELFNELNGMRKNVPKVNLSLSLSLSLSNLCLSCRPISFFSFQFLLVLTDGDQDRDDSYVPLDLAAKEVKDKDVQVFAVSCRSDRDTNKADLLKIASNNRYVFIRPLGQIQGVGPSIVNEWKNVLQGKTQYSNKFSRVVSVLSTRVCWCVRASMRVCARLKAKVETYNSYTE